MNVFWKWTFNTHSETIAYSAMLLGFIIGYLKAGWLNGVLYAMIAPFVALPILVLLAALGAFWQVLSRKS